MAFNSALAWWYLTREEKAALQAERLAGRFGGHPIMAKYWHLQEMGTYPAPGGGKAKNFVAQAVADVDAFLYVLDGWSIERLA